VLQCKSDPARAQQMGINGRRYADQHLSRECCVQQTVNVFERVVEQHRTSTLEAYNSALQNLQDMHNETQEPTRMRLAKEVDCRELAEIFYICSREQPGSFLYKLGKRFLREDLRATLRNTHSVILCSLDDTGRIVGFVSGSLNAANHWTWLRKHRFRLALAAAPALICKPRLILDLIKRYRFLFGSRQKQVRLIWSGARCGYWAMLPTARGNLASVMLFRKWMELMRLLGAKDIMLEVDHENPRSEETHRRLGAKPAVEFVAPGRTLRKIMIYPAPTAKRPK
jgi:hypothetical protein